MWKATVASELKIVVKPNTNTTADVNAVCDYMRAEVFRVGDQGWGEATS